MAKTCAQCNKEYKGDTCPTCTETGVDIGKVLESEKEQMEKNESAVPTAFLVDLVSNRKIPITTPRCRVGRDDLNDIVISGDQSISRFHFIITYEDSQYYVQDAKSRHGTFLNGNQISGPEAINDGDVLKIGVSLFWFVIESAQGGSEESLQPVDVEKIASEELSLKKGSPVAAMSEAELTATMEIDLPTAGALAAAEAKVMEAAEAAKSTRDDEESRADKAEPADSKEEDLEPESKSDSTSAEDEAEDEEPAEDADTDEEKAEPESEMKDDAPAEDEAKSARVTSESDIEMTVKDLLEPLQDELEASRAMIKDALKKGDLKDEEPAEGKSEEDTPESKDEVEDDSKDDEKSKDSVEPESKDDDDDKKGAEPVSDGEPEEKKDSEDKESEEESKSDPLSVSGLDVEPADVPVSGLDDDKEEEESKGEKPESKDEEPEPESRDEDEKRESEKEEPEPESKDDEPESKEETDENAEPADKSEDDVESDSSRKDKTSKGKSAEAETLEKIAEIIDDSSSKQEAEPEPEASRQDTDSQKEADSSRDDDGKTTHAEPATMETANGAEEEITIMGPTNVPDWCKKYFSDELKHLTKELDSLNEQIKQTQERIRKIEGKAALTKGLRNTLLTADGDDLIEACIKVLGLAGWKVTQSDDDKNELVLEHHDEQVAIARIIWTKDKAERSHLGQLSISQTRYWCENGVEPKGILILSKLSDKAPTDRSNEADADLVTYAQQKNVCLMDTVQLLALYRDIALKDAKTDEKREKIQDGKGWLSGFELEPGDEADDSEEKEATKGKSLSSLLSA